MFEAPSSNIVVAIIALILSLVIFGIKVVSRHEKQPALDNLESFTEFPVDASAAWLSLGLGLLASHRIFSDVQLLNILILVCCLGAQLLSLWAVRGVILDSTTSKGGLLKVILPGVSWGALFVGAATVITIAGAALNHD